MNTLTNFEPLSIANARDLATVYKLVFQGAPWYEDRVCSGVLLNEEDAKRCMLQYTAKTVPKAVKGVIGSVDFTQTKNCTSCQKPLIEFYPDVVNPKELLDEASQKSGFTGLLAKSGEQLQRFGWGYAVPEMRTRSVDFPKSLPLLLTKGIKRESAFYWSEIGVIESCQGRGLGKIIATSIASKAAQQGYEWFTLRTKNPVMNKMLASLFPQEEIMPIFEDPVRGTPWYALRLANLVQQSPVYPI